MKNIIKGFGLALAMMASSAHAIPTLFFEGTMSYTAGGELSVTSGLTGTADIAPLPNLAGSSFDFSALLLSVDITNPYFTIGNFGTTAGTDLTVMDGGGIELLTGNFTELQMFGGNGLDSGFVTGTLSASSGSLQSEFGTGNLIAFVLNLTTMSSATVFSDTMFDNDFTGDIGGRIEGEAINVPEPTPLALLALGMLLVGFIKQSRIHRTLL